MADPSKTEKATPKRRRDERKKGNVSMSQDAVSVTTLIGACAMFFLWYPTIAEEAADFMSFCIQRCAASGPTMEVLSDLFGQAVLVLAKAVGPLLLVTAACAVAATFAQTRMLIAGELLKPKLERISIIAGFKRLFSLRGLVEALKGILKITLLIVLIYISIKDFFLESSRYLYTDIPAAVMHLLGAGQDMMVRIIIAFVVLAAADFFYQRWHYENQLKMSKQEVKEEYKQLEGDPQIKGKIREIQRQRSMSRMMQKVPQADVVIRNPTHYAVALRYKPEEDSAPVVLAKGQDELALRIVKAAEEAGVAVMENVALARALYAQAELDREIPPSLYEAVAEVLVYIFRLNENKQIVR